MMEIYTGYFSYTKKYEELGLMPISIARKTPKWFTGGNCLSFSPAATTLWDYKEGLIEKEQYTLEYKERLDNTAISLIIATHITEAKQKGYKGIIYLCYEKTGDFCHRNIFADYCKQKYNLNIKEYQF